ncbi:hypothetical protein LSTR_LSTR005592 [Laodelphax striatellus]|uniref:Amine oxidase domain-containing protein n=1 Tax=Laodelphax striatellus TaxID=195883 RepID=A0A482WYH1_LAOST|nr:hypothetical protein LSTR_LSTR005592 [Laodelphax striatellus]
MILKNIYTRLKINSTNTYFRSYKTSSSVSKNILICKKQKLEKICLIDKDLVDPCKESPKVIIVGAGMAGLSAAARLFKAGVTDITVLEASDRPGGRIHSCWLKDAIAEIGAQWITGCNISNSIMTLACQEGLLEPSTAHRYEKFKGVYMTSSGQAIKQHIALRAFLCYEQILHKAGALYSLACGRDHGSMMTYISLSIERELQNFPPHERHEASCVMYGLTNRISNKWGADLDDMSVDLFGSRKDISGEVLGIPLGFVGVLAPLIKQIPHDRILYSKEVNNIHWCETCDAKLGGSRASVKCCDGSVYCGDYVIVTIPLGVLKAKHDKLFVPKLPAEKVEAIKNLGFGNINKIFLQYDNPFWVWGRGTMNFARTIEELRDECEWTNGIHGLEEVQGSQEILMIEVSGKHADAVEKLTDDNIAQDVTCLLRKFVGDPTIPYPSSILRSKWKENSNFLGAGSYFSVNSTVGHQLDLQSPIPSFPCTTGEEGEPPEIAPVLLFAGEATCPTYFSTVHGARLSGLQAAQDIISLTKIYAGPPPLLGEKPKIEDPC